MIAALLILISALPCDTLMSKLQFAKTFPEAVELLENSHERLSNEQLDFWSQAFRMPFKSEREFVEHLKLLSDANKRLR